MRAGEELLELLAATTVLACLLPTRLFPVRLDGTSLAAIAETVARLNAVRLGVALTGTVAAIAVLGSAAQTGLIDAAALDLGAEQSLPTMFSALILLSAAALAALNAQIAEARLTRWWAVLAVTFGFLAADEVVGVHEKTQAWTGTFGQAALLPLVLAAFVAWVVVLRRMWSYRPVVALLVGGAATWAIAQAIDLAQYTGELASLTIFEETLELAGGVSFALAMLTAMQAAGGLAASRARLGTREAPAADRWRPVGPSHR